MLPSTSLHPVPEKMPATTSIKQAHSWIELSKQALINNLNLYKRLIGSAQLAPVLKANAYGHGMIPVAEICEQHPAVDWLCVALLSEAIALRNHGIKKPILVLSHLDDALELAIINSIDVVVYDLETIQELNSIARQHGAKVRVHIKIDTGLSRLGIMHDQALEFIIKVLEFDHVIINGIFTHYAEAESADHSFSLVQQHHFELLLDKLVAFGITIPHVHLGNSAVAGNHMLRKGNLFRIGAGLYGFWSSEHVKQQVLLQADELYLLPVLTWKSRIITIKTIPAGGYFGYNRTVQAVRDTVIAIVPVGYYEGYDRRLSNCGTMMVQGVQAPVLGRICMNLTTIDITDIPGCSVGDEVTLLGNQPKLSAIEVAQIIGSFNPREITSRINPFLPRVVV